MKGRFPDFLIIGGMKCGTTSLHDYLGKHPDVFMSTPKELHFFNEGNFDPARIDWYKGHFETDAKVCGASPQDYTKCHNKYYQGIPARLKQYMPAVKLIYIVRDPIPRAISHIKDNYFNEPAHDVAYNIESGHYAKTSMYGMQLSAYLEHFDKDQILVITLEDLSGERLKTLNEVFRFLGVSEMSDAALFSYTANKHEDKGYPKWFRNLYLYRLMNKLFPGIVLKFASNKWLKANVFDKRMQKLLERADIERYRKEIEADINRFRELTGKSFSGWSV